MLRAAVPKSACGPTSPEPVDGDYSRLEYPNSLRANPSIGDNVDSFQAGDHLNNTFNMAAGESALRLTGQTPFRARVCDPEPFALGVALGVAARLRDHHRQLAAVIVGVAHTLSKERGLQPATAQFR